MPGRAGGYELSIRFENGLEDPPEDITAEITDEGAEHQVFFTGSAVNGPATNNPDAPMTQAYDDTDTNGLPLGLKSTISAKTGNGVLTLTLRHLPPVNGNPVKVADIASLVADGGFAVIGGNSDVQIDFMVTVE